nr:unnamed protein product [Callosobruchus chinensis]
MEMLQLLLRKIANISHIKDILIEASLSEFLTNCARLKAGKLLDKAKSCQTVMIRGLVPNWKQPIYYHFDQPMVKYVLLKIICKLFEANFIVVAIVSDMGTGNVALWRELNVGHDKKCHFAHPCDDSLKIFVWADVPHLIKLMRNHLIDHSFYVDDYIINKDYFQALLKLSSTELTIAHKLTQVQLLSNTVAKAITYAGGHRLMPKNSKWLEASAIVQLFNDWFDLMNSRSKFVISCPGRNAFGTDIEKQKELLHKMTEVINIIRVGKHKNLIPFQKGIILSNKSLIEMFEYVSEKYKVEYVLTSRLNQDVLEIFFSYIRGMGDSNDHPSSAIFTENRNTAESTESCFFNVLNEPSVETIQEDICITQRMLSNLVETDIWFHILVIATQVSYQ